MVDVVVVGGGPAGAVAAALLAEQAFSVLLLDRACFPRDKACGEFLTPGAVAILRNLDVWPLVVAAGARPVRSAMFAAGSGASAVYTPPDGQPAGWAIRRTALDAVLLEHASSCGVQVREGAPVLGLLRDRGDVRGVRIAEKPGAPPTEVPSHLVIGADGSHSRVAREMRLVRPLRRLHRVAVVTHWYGLPDTDAIEMRARGRVVCGYGPLGDGHANVTLVVPRDEAPRIAGRAGTWTEERVRACFPELAARLARGNRERNAITVGCFGHLCRRTTAAGMMLVGDAAGFVDPFTGEGMYHALRGAQLAADVAGRALRAGDVSARRLSEYDRLRRELRGRHLLCGIVQAVVRTPALMERAIGRLGRDPRLAERLMAVLGDKRPPADALRLGLAWRLLA